MDHTPTSTSPTGPTQSQVNAAEATVQHILALEASPGWIWHRSQLQFKRDSLANQVLNDDTLSPEQRERVRFGYRTLKRALEDIDTDMQKAMHILLLVDRLPAHLHDRLLISSQPAESDSLIDGINPFAQTNLDLSTLFGYTPPT